MECSPQELSIWPKAWVKLPPGLSGRLLRVYIEGSSSCRCSASLSKFTVQRTRTLKMRCGLQMWLAYYPAGARLRHTNHVHDAAFCSGVYYAEVTPVHRPCSCFSVLLQFPYSISAVSSVLESHHSRRFIVMMMMMMMMSSVCLTHNGRLNSLPSLLPSHHSHILPPQHRSGTRRPPARWSSPTRAGSGPFEQSAAEVPHASTAKLTDNSCLTCPQADALHRGLPRCRPPARGPVLRPVLVLPEGRRP